MEIHYLTYQQIIKTKWDACIDKADNGLIYAYSFYLDAMAKHWDALVMNDYEAVMPLTWNKKYSIHYLYQPPFTACLGVFGKLLTAETVTNSYRQFHQNLNTGIFILTPAIFLSLTIFICTNG